MLNNRYIIFTLFLLVSIFTVKAQKEEREYIRKGNRAYKDSIFVDAEVKYRKALDVNPQSTISMYNLGNTLLYQQKAQEAIEQYQKAANLEKDKNKLAQIYHNTGVLFHATKDYAKAIEAYKMSLRNNPKDDETRYNLALAQKMLQDQKDENQQENQDNKENQQEQQDKEDQKKQQEEQKNKQEQEKQEKQKQEQQQSEQQEQEMSKENVEQMLNSVMQDEKDVQEKVKKQMQVIQSRPLENDW